MVKLSHIDAIIEENKDWDVLPGVPFEKHFISRIELNVLKRRMAIKKPLQSDLNIQYYNFEIFL